MTPEEGAVIVRALIAQTGVEPPSIDKLAKFIKVLDIAEKDDLTALAEWILELKAKADAAELIARAARRE